MTRYRTLLISLCIASMMMAAGGCSNASRPSSTMSDKTSTTGIPDEIRGVWVWKDIVVKTDKEQDRLLDFCERHDINLLLMQVHQIDGAPEPTITYPKKLARLIREASKRGIVVEALDGAKDMAMAKNQDETLAVLDMFITYNQSLPEGERFVAVHYDIEPYLLSGWKESQESRNVIMRDLVEYYAKARKKLDERGSDMLLACDIPMWYDLKTEPGDSCIMEYNGQTKNLHQHIQDICDYIGIMSYRTHAVGDNSITYMVENEMAYAESIGKKVCAAFEVSKLENTPQISFYGWAPEDYLEQYNLTRKTLADRPGYGGVLIQSVRALRALLENEPLPE